MPTVIGIAFTDDEMKHLRDLAVVEGVTISRLLRGHLGLRGEYNPSDHVFLNEFEQLDSVHKLHKAMLWLVTEQDRTTRQLARTQLAMGRMARVLERMHAELVDISNRLPDLIKPTVGALQQGQIETDLNHVSKFLAEAS